MIDVASIVASIIMALGVVRVLLVPVQLPPNVTAESHTGGPLRLGSVTYSLDDCSQCISQ
jgi:hypothetical protein